MTALSPEWQDHRCHALSPEPSVIEPPVLKGLPLIIGTSLATLMVLAVGIGVVAAGIIMNRAERRRALEERLAYRSND